MYTSSIPKYSDYSLELIRSNYYKAYYSDTTTGSNNEIYDHLVIVAGRLSNITVTNCSKYLFLNYSGYGGVGIAYIPAGTSNWTVHEIAGTGDTASWAEYRIVPPAE